MKSAFAVVAILAAASVARADDGAGTAFSKLQEVGKSWQFEVVTGKSLAALAPVKGAPGSRCTVTAWKEPDDEVRSKLVCETEPPAKAGAPNALAPTLLLVYGKQGVRQVSDAKASLADAANVLAFTFPEQLTKGWTRGGTGPDGTRSTVAVGEGALTIGRRTVKAWLAERTSWPAAAQGKGPPQLGAAMYDRGHGPLLICTAVDATGYTCLRRTKLDPKDEVVEPGTAADPLAEGAESKPPKPTAAISLAGKTAHDKSSLKADAVASKFASAYLAGVRRCYRDLLRKKPTAAGAVKLAFTVNAVGKTEDATAKTFDAALTACVQPQLAAWRFPIPMSEYGEPRTARFTLDLKLAAQ